MSTEPELLVVDRFEDDLAVLVSAADAAVTLEVERSLLPGGARPGAVLRVVRDAEGNVRWSEARVDERATEARLEEARRLLDELRHRDPGGDVEL
ncbi:MAG TPA: DUF3006 domain-containing protein [Longimicrobiales bacterium]|nr:DUF3006 domain-containing protein [Longimicrobiales bacterium]